MLCLAAAQHAGMKEGLFNPLYVFLSVMQSDHGAEDAGWEGECQPTVMWIKALKEYMPATKTLLFQCDKLKVKAPQPNIYLLEQKVHPFKNDNLPKLV